MADTYQILVVDDDFSIVNIIETALKQAGYQVLTAYNGEAACQIVNTRHPHLIIMDVMMPQCNGIIATMKIRQNNNVPILMLSAKAEGSDRVLGLEAEADDYLVKPFYQQELLARVKALLRRYDALGSIRKSNSGRQYRTGHRQEAACRPGRSGSTYCNGVQNFASADVQSGAGVLCRGNLRTSLGMRCLRRGKYRHGTHQSYPRKTGDQSKEAGISESCLGDWICL